MRLQLFLLPKIITVRKKDIVSDYFKMSLSPNVMEQNLTIMFSMLHDLHTSNTSSLRL